MTTPDSSSPQPDNPHPLGYPGFPLHPADPYKGAAHAMAAVFTLTLPVLIGVIVLLKPDPLASRGVMLAGGAVAGAPVAAGGSSAGPQTPAEVGRAVYEKSCVVCHGPEAEGIANLGKPLRNSAFVQSKTDDELFTLVVNGRPPEDPANTTGAAMPPRGAQNLSDEQIRAVIAYLRSIQDPSAPPASVDAWNLKSADGTTKAASIELPDHPGHDIFIASCSACHGADAAGLPNLGLPLTTSGFVRGKTDKELINFIKGGRPSWDAANTTGVDMPPKGGNPAITDEQLQLIVSYIRALQEKALGP
ncbi:MAG TPA: c-type cytochrome [Phycisphaerales bacterium]|nr:c-type cytochrome [Phycisphaerales bacterium]